MKITSLLLLAAIAVPATTLRAQTPPPPSTTARTNSRYLRIRDIPEAQREAVTLSRKDADRESCGITFTPTTAPFVRYVDQTRMRAIIDAEKTIAKDRYVLYSVRIDTAGVVSSRVIETTMKSDQVARINAAINPAIIGRPDTAAVQFRLRLDPGSADEPLRLGHSLSCAPRMKNVRRVRNAIYELTPQKFHPVVENPRTIVWIFMDEKGTPRQSRISASSGDSIFDAEAANLLMKYLRFEPAMFDGKPGPVWASVPVYLNDRSQ
jgi:hypothetical protein